MIWLLLDTACPQALVAIAEDDKVLAEVTLQETKQHGELLASAIDECLRKAKISFAELDGVACGEGPGSFVGVRVAIAHAKGICVARKLPLIGVSTLLSIASEPGLPAGEGLAVIDARRDEVYVLRVKRNGGVFPISSPQALSLDAVSQAATGVDSVVGFGPIDCLTHRRDGPTAGGMLIAFLQTIKDGVVDELHSLEPDYVRAPDAKVPSPFNKG